MLVEQVVSLAAVVVDRDGSVWWSEGRPGEGGRVAVVRDGVDVLPAPWSARTRVHEYGGGAFTVHQGTLFFSNVDDQRVYRLDRGATEPVAITPDDGSRYADGTVTPDGRWLVCVRERHGEGEAVNDLVAVPTAADGEETVVLASGYDFFSFPRPGLREGELAYVAWDHPNMPWDCTSLWLRDELVAGGADSEESVTQPRWSPDGVLHWISDRTGWWNLYRHPGEPLAPMDAEFAGPDWTFGNSSYTFLTDGRLVATWSEDGLGRLGLVAGGRAVPVTLDTTLTSFSSLRSGPRPTEVVAVAASPSRAPAVVVIDIDSGAVRALKQSRAAPVPAGAISEPRALTYGSEGGRPAHALYYPPRLEGYQGPPGERPPLIVRSHGGPTSAASSTLNPEIQFWTSRGFAVVDVDYSGSSGYGRDYRRRLSGQWGVADLDDCVNAARHLAASGEVDGNRMVVRGGSAGGYTTLCAMAFRDVFAAGASYYGVADLETLVADTHKFESRYLDGLIGPYPEAKDVYEARSPIHAADRITSPLILLQGLEDAVVPPSQAEAMVAELAANGTPHAYVAFEGEQHGFRKAENIIRAVEAELSFYGQVLGFEPAGDIEPVAIVRP